MTTIVIIDYGSGNVRSVGRALSSSAASCGLALSTTVTSDPDLIRRADRIVLPGVGHFADCVDGLRSRTGVVDAMTEAVFVRGAPFLGICVGMQLLADVGREDVERPGLGWISGAVERIEPDKPALPVPHMGWNTLSLAAPHPVLDRLGGEPHVYFTHSYAFTPANPADIAAVTDYGGAITSAVARDNLFGAQFHPEKSQQTGQKVLANFLNWRP
ncbi:MAG: imidazole glycerol phosphate synthase subunit HisH [Alphaproteobacteria bacterium]|nr:imidazole glycerol phosphate synthase subunit HisH [Alphaproteobacteria bacterium]